MRLKPFYKQGNSSTCAVYCCSISSDSADDLRGGGVSIEGPWGPPLGTPLADTPWGYPLQTPLGDTPWRHPLGTPLGDTPWGNLLGTPLGDTLGVTPRGHPLGLVPVLKPFPSQPASKHSYAFINVHYFQSSHMKNSLPDCFLLYES